MTWFLYSASQKHATLFIDHDYWIGKSIDLKAFDIKHNSSENSKIAAYMYDYDEISIEQHKDDTKIKLKSTISVVECTTRLYKIMKCL